MPPLLFVTRGAAVISGEAFISMALWLTGGGRRRL